MTQDKYDVLDIEYKKYVLGLRKDWITENRSTSRDVIEVMSPEECKKVHDIIDQWGRYIAPLAEEWWKVYGGTIIWPEDNAEPMRVQF
jgi:hypothetical protein